MSSEDDDKAVIEIGEEAWEEDKVDPDTSSVEHSLRPLPPPVPSVRPSQRPEQPTGFSSPAVTEPSLSGEHLVRARRVGTGIWYAGVLLWAYLIVGEYVVGPGLPEVVGWSTFVGIIVGAFLHGSNRIGTEVMRKVAAISVVAVILTVLFLSSIVGSSQRSEYQGMSLFLLAVSVGLILYGIRFARGGLPRSIGPKETKWGRVLTWVLFVSNTGLIAIAFLAQIS